ncbi:MAG: response regulator transcription factor [Mariprofundaceae bacterium]|nr:response regulator transcription factor [Mariprofundaceae bacterium]
MNLVESCYNQSYSQAMHILIADDHALFRGGMVRLLCDALSPEHGDIQVSEAADVAEALELTATAIDIDLILMDLKMPGMDGMEGLKAVCASAPATPVAMMSSCEDGAVVQAAIAAGAAGFIPKSTSCDIMRHAILMIMDGGIYLPPHLLMQTHVSGESDLSEHQKHILTLLAQGHANKSIAFELGISEGTVKQHIHSIYKKLAITSRTQALLKAQDMGLV